MRFILADKNLVVAGRQYEGFPLLIGDDGDAIQPAQEFLWKMLGEDGRKSSQHTWEAYGRYLYDFFGYVLTQNLDWKSPSVYGKPSAISAWRDWSIGTLKLSKGTVNQRLRVVVRFYVWALGKGYIDSLPFTYTDVKARRHPGFLAHVDVTGGVVSSPDVMLTDPERRIELLDKSQIIACSNTLHNLTHNLLFQVKVRTGLRQVEARTFPESYVFDPSRRKDLQPGMKIRLHLDPRDMKLKFDKSRDIDMPYDLMEQLWNYSARRRQKRENANATGTVYPNLFLTERGVPYSKNAITAIYRRLSDRVGFKVNAHMLRHTYATFLLWNLRKSKTFQGEPLTYVRDRLGHKDVSTTTVYLHLINSLAGQLVLAHEDEIDQLFAERHSSTKP